ncbi:hypothetical protein LWI28_023002 [Acer negundo]|uniref:Uncharacterized protein n=1 Tax=Acer negundo TaxID=4023 RepID=A0AAD5P3Y5_ACENE|nr:hypothetical protein LWI28_023002 [Acer negundo]
MSNMFIGAFGSTFIEDILRLRKDILRLRKDRRLASVCDEYLCQGWEDTAHNNRVFLSVLRDPQSNFPKPPNANPNLTITDFNPFFILFNSVDYAHRSLFYRLYGLICFDYWFLRLKIGLAGY